MAYEKMPCLYETEQDLAARLGGTVCRYKGQPVKVDVEGKNELYLYSLGDGKRVEIIKPSDPDFDISSAEVGYVNYQMSTSLLHYIGERNALAPQLRVFYLERGPFRRYRQGLNSDSVVSYYIDGTSASGTLTGHIIYSKGLEESLLGKYPSVRAAHAMLRTPEFKEIAISMDTAIKKIESGIFLVYYRKQNIGWMTPDKPVIQYQEGNEWIYRRLLKRFQ